MQNEAGSLSQTSSNAAPWEQVWGVVRGAGESVVKALSGSDKGVDGSKKPWEMIWGATTRPDVPPSPQPVKAPSQGFNLDEYLPKLSRIESGDNPDAKSKTSSATGLYQFTEATWKDANRQMGKGYSLADRKDPAKSQEVVAFFTQKNIDRAVEDLGRHPKEHELYMYHLLGRNGAGDMLQAPPDKPATSFATAKQAKANKGVFYKPDGSKRTVGEVLSMFKQKFENYAKKG